MLSLVIHHTCYVKQTQINEQNNSYSMYSLIRCANEYKQMSCSTRSALFINKCHAAPEVLYL
jgi:hypothetical protein